MKKRTGIIGVLIAVLVMAVGYAAITAIPLEVTGSGTIVPDQDNFQVIFIDADVTEAPATATATATIDASDETTANMSVTNLKMTNETATFTFLIQNISPENILANLAAPTLSYTNQEYFEVTAELGAETLLAVDDVATLTVTVRTIKAPLDDVTTDITVQVNANPQLPA